MKRRDFIKGLGSVALVTPWVTGLLSRIANAQDGVFPTRFYLLFTGNGPHPEQWIPRDAHEVDFDLPPALAPLAPNRDKLLFLRGFSDGNTHSVGMSGSTTGRPSTNGNGVAKGGPSIDQLFADAWHGRTPLHSLDLGVEPANEPHDQMCYSAAGLPIPPIGSGRGAFEKVFALTNEDPAVADLRRAQKRSVLDVISRDLVTLQNRLGVRARRLLDEHLTLVREQEVDLARPFVPTACDLAVPGPDDTPGNTWSNHNQTVLSSFRCDVTRVTSMRVGGWGGIESGSYGEIGLANGHHSAAHGDSIDSVSDLEAINRLHADRFNALLTALDAVPEGAGTLLDNTVAVWLHELGIGEFTHGRADVGMVLAGGRSVGMAQGRARLVAITDENRYPRFRAATGVDYQHFLFSLAQMLGQRGLQQFGDRGTIVMPELFA